MRSISRSFLIDSLSFAAALLTYPAMRIHYWLRQRILRLSANRHSLSAIANGHSEMSLNDPQWGKRDNNNSSGGGGGKNDGPPDLDQIIKKFNEKIAGLFGQKPTGNNNGGGGFNAPSGAAMGGGFAIAAVIALAVWLATGFYIVEEGSRGIELRLGKYSQTTAPGPHLHWPYPFEKVEIVNISQVRAIEVGHRNNQKTKMKDESLMLTEDQNIVDVQFAVQYTLKSPEEFLFNNRQPDEAVRQVAETAMREIVGRSKNGFCVVRRSRGHWHARQNTHANYLRPV